MRDRLDVNAVWLKQLRALVDKDHHGLAPRGLSLRAELLASQTVIDMRLATFSILERALSRRFMFGEAWWILSGSDRVESISPFCKHIARFSDDGDIFFGAYGPKIKAQLPYVLDKLFDDVSSRQCVINVWRESPPLTKDVPCTLSIQFLVRGGALHLVVAMRSSDIWLGFPYDVFNFTALAFYVSLLLRENGIMVDLGNLYLTAGSQHLYESDADNAERLLLAVAEAPPSSTIFAFADRFLPKETFVSTLYAIATSKL